MTSSSSSAAWSPLPETEWDAAAARHLLQRTGWSATPTAIKTAQQAGLAKTLDRLFPPSSIEFRAPQSVAKLREPDPRELRETAPAERRNRRRELREIYRKAQMDLSLAWLQFAATPVVAAQEKWTLFLSDIYVVAAAKVRNPSLLQAHFDLLRRHGFGSAPGLTKAVSRSPAMIEYLDLQRSQREAPNENFARELFELFVLGEGNYTEADIKNAARAFTGYRQRQGTFFEQRREKDTGRKTLFGRSGNFDGDAVIDQAYREPAANRFLPAAMVRFYLTNDPLPPETLSSLGHWWQSVGFNLRQLAHRFFSSRLFFDQRYRANYIKSPIQFYLGLLHDLQLDVTPLPRATLRPLQQMGQMPFNPPNVRGWVGGHAWINSATLAARRQIVMSLFTPIPDERLNADELAALRQARSEGRASFNVTAADLGQRFGGHDAPSTAALLTANFLPAPVNEDFMKIVTAALAEDDPLSVSPERLARVLETVLQSPLYQLC